ncbi:MAG: SEC-C metal-binding domain-containing protein [Planctomycetota bacterium]
MSDANARLAAVAFAESRHAAGLGLAKADLIEGARRFVLACYQDAGAAPEKLDGEQMRELLAVHLPRRCWPKDAFVPAMAALLQAFLQDLEERTIVPHAYELRQALADAGERFPAAVRNIADGERRLDDAPVADLTRRGAKIGRNDPCPCGSGKKYKQCCMKI